MPIRKLRFSIRTLIAVTALVAIGIVAWQYVNRPPPPTSAWEAFLLGVTTLQETGDRKLAARQFDAVEALFPNSEYKTDSLELAQQLRILMAEDRAWREPSDPQQLPLLQQIKYHIHHLRDVNCYQLSLPGRCHVLTDFGNDYNAAIALHEIGEPAIPYLIPLLKDRRPIRSVGCWRNLAKYRTVLRLSLIHI